MGKPHKKLKVCQNTMELYTKIYEITEAFPYFAISLLSLLLMILTPSTLQAWARHNLITKYALESNESYKNSVTVVTEISSDNSINPEYTPIYTNPDFKNNKIDCNRFMNYDLDNGLYYGFEGKGLSEKTSIYEILVHFSDEPDWGMDKNINLSFAQKLMAGSQGYRHMYYPFWTFHLPYPFIAQGEAPERAQHFFDRAVEEYKRGNTYAAYRELARSIHYVMDMAQPFHTYQLPLRLIQFDSPFNGTVQAIKNYHFAYETFVANLLQMEDCASGGMLSKSIKDAEPLITNNSRDLALLIARRSNKIAKRLIPLAIEIFGKRFNSAEPQSLTESEFKELLNSNNKSMREFFDLTQQTLILASGGIKGLLDLFLRVS